MTHHRHHQHNRAASHIDDRTAVTGDTPVTPSSSDGGVHDHAERQRRRVSRHAHASEPSSTSERSPSQRYQDFRDRLRHDDSACGRFEAQAPFELDDFQREANEALESGDNVLVAAPTGAGKTVVADFAIFLAQERNVKAFYTTPIKALSNQKYHDLVDRYGADRVGLLTGDISINAEADIVVMTTEVLRNMIYERSTTLQALRYVVLDEVHYLADRFRGPVWEEVIVQLPKQVRVIGLSATVSNVEDFSSWIASVRGSTHLVISEHRPVPLQQHVLLQADDHTEPELIDLYRHENRDGVKDAVNPALAGRLEQLDPQVTRRARAVRPERSRHGRHPHGREHEHAPVAQRHTPRRWAVVDELNYMGMLPGIYFIFSRNGCDKAVEQCLDAGLELTTHDEALRIRRIVDAMVEGQMSHDDLKALRFSRFRYALEEGFAPHHAGLVTLFRSIVEHLFELGLVKMVFATETLALGINMPARTVVVEKLEKFNGSEHVMLTPGEFTQLTGRAGRRGIDTLGHAVVVDHRDFAPAALVSLSSKRVYPLHSSFKATFNMAANLLANSDYATARATLDQSFAQWEANESSWQLESRITTLRDAVAGYERAFHCEYGDFRELLLIRRRLHDLEHGERQQLKRQRFSSTSARTEALRDLDRRINTLRAEDRDHPCHDCPDLATHMTWGHRWNREESELERLEERYRTRTGSVARQFDRICEILSSWGYLERHDAPDHACTKPDTAPGDMTRSDMTLTPRGELLRRLFGEHDLVLAQAVTTTVLDHLNPRELASTLSSLVYEARRGSGGEPDGYPGGPTGRVALACEGLRDIAGRVADRCHDADLEVTGTLDFGLVSIIHAWAGGADLTDVLRDSELTGGDFVRCAKRLADLLQQIAVAAPYCPQASPTLADTAMAARRLVFRGVVSYSGVED
ncbi:DEAD/DEAH box helicase [Bifidobacterium mongoliense]|uniref:DEAD/DEAH box helicase n=1 Tax=Bifidobacterium mongoliense DSM 21395 TaxID=1437603 RepID=A0A087C0L5_9BIFI|nr:DEAD/DEAH box helicase [Bifidobacterium mongoliense]KFI76815.1 DEAD/DEAH box helicase [Bifidobacterium mongoliense DSM 21395]